MHLLIQSVLTVQVGGKRDVGMGGVEAAGEQIDDDVVEVTGVDTESVLDGVLRSVPGGGVKVQ